MHVNARKMAFAGLLTAFVAILLVLSSVIESNSLFLIAAASFCVGIAIREWQVRLGTAFLVSSTLISLLVAPNKFYCITYAAMGIYLVLSEILWDKIAEKQDVKNKERVLWIGRYLIFNCIYIPSIVFFQELLFVKKVSGVLLLGAIVIGQLILFVYEKSYGYFQIAIWGKLRTKIM